MIRTAAITLFAFSAAIFAQQRPNSLAPWVTSPISVVEKMLTLANLKPGETLYDLGSGDGRVLVMAATKYQAKAVGIELSPRLVKATEERIKQEGLEGKVSVVHANMLDADISGADVVTLYLLRDSNDVMRPKLEASLKPGARVVSHDYEIRGWKPSAVEKTEDKRSHVIYLYEMPQRAK